MRTRKSLKEYSELLVNAMNLYSEYTVMEILNHLQTDEKVTRVHQIIMQDPTEEEFLQQIEDI